MQKIKLVYALGDGNVFEVKRKAFTCEVSQTIEMLTESIENLGGIVLGIKVK